MSARRPISELELWERIKPAFPSLCDEQVLSFSLDLRAGKIPLVTVEMIPDEEQADAIAAVFRHYVLIPKEDL